MIDFKKSGSDIQVHKLNDEELEILKEKNLLENQTIINEIRKRKIKSLNVEVGQCFKSEDDSTISYTKITSIGNRYIITDIISIHKNYNDVTTSRDEDFTYDGFYSVYKSMIPITPDIFEKMDTLAEELYNKQEELTKEYIRKMQKTESVLDM